jgi:hypothetical protein
MFWWEEIILGCGENRELKNKGRVRDMLHLLRKNFDISEQIIKCNKGSLMVL